MSRVGHDAGAPAIVAPPQSASTAKQTDALTRQAPRRATSQETCRLRARLTWRASARDPPRRLVIARARPVDFAGNGPFPAVQQRTRWTYAGTRVTGVTAHARCTGTSPCWVLSHSTSRWLIRLAACARPPSGADSRAIGLSRLPDSGVVALVGRAVRPLLAPGRRRVHSHWQVAHGCAARCGGSRDRGLDQSLRCRSRRWRGGAGGRSAARRCHGDER